MNSKNKFHIQADKSLGQHFLKNLSTIERICHFPKEIPQPEFIVEVGPGPGVLTIPLKDKYPLPLYVIEKDSRVQSFLEDLLSEQHVFLQDATKISYASWLTDLSLQGSKGWLVSNLPYNVSSVLLRLFINEPEFCYMTLMFQKEVGEKLLPRYPKNNSLRVLVELFYTVELVEIVKPGAFHPPPKVDSIVVFLKHRSDPPFARSELPYIETFVRRLFQHPRKQIGPKLEQIFQQKLASSLELTGLMNKLHLSRQDRSETLTLLQIVGLYEMYKSQSSTRSSLPL